MKSSNSFNAPFEKSFLNKKAVSLTLQLQKHGYQAYLVGGCVRDLLLKQRPKDWDIATDAKPNQIKKIFSRRSRIIGRRFPIVHVKAGRQTFELATFRAPPRKKRIIKTLARDARFGTIESDAKRRDFTVNSFYLNPQTMKIFDFHCGRKNLKENKLISIGPPKERFREDPVRILRLIKFMRRLNFEIGEQEIEAAESLSYLMTEVAPARLTDETLKLLRIQDTAGAFLDLKELNLIGTLLPEVDEWINKDEQRFSVLISRMQALDSMPWKSPPTSSLLLSVLYGPCVEEDILNSEFYEFHTPQKIANRWVQLFSQRGHIPRDISQSAKSILAIQHQLEPGISPKDFGISKRGIAYLRNQPYLRDALRYLEIRLRANNSDLKLSEDWRNKLLPKRTPRR